MSNIGKEHLARVVSENTGLNLIDARLIVMAFLEAIKTELANGKKIEIRGLGSFYVKEYAPARGRNPRSGETIFVPRRKKPIFKVSQLITDKLNSN
jgi:integration host factor subunit beta